MSLNSFQILGIIIGTAYLNQPLTSAGAFTRGGLIFTALLNICLDAFGEVGLLSSILSWFLSNSTDADANDWEADFAEASELRSPAPGPFIVNSFC